MQQSRGMARYLVPLSADPHDVPYTPPYTLSAVDTTALSIHILSILADCDSTMEPFKSSDIAASLDKAILDTPDSFVLHHVVDAMTHTRTLRHSVSMSEQETSLYVRCGQDHDVAGTAFVTYPRYIDALPTKHLQRALHLYARTHSRTSFADLWTHLAVGMALYDENDGEKTLDAINDCVGYIPACPVVRYVHRRAELALTNAPHEWCAETVVAAVAHVGMDADVCPQYVPDLDHSDIAHAMTMGTLRRKLAINAATVVVSDTRLSSEHKRRLLKQLYA